MRYFVTILFTSLLWVSTAFAEMKSVAVPTANFRNKPSTESDVKFQGMRYFPVEILSEKDGWSHVRDYEGEKAWVASRLLTSDVPTVAIKAKRCNIRSGPGTNHDVAFKVERGEVFKVIKKEGRWLHLVDINNEKGWVRDDLVWGMTKHKSL